jgi:RND family efflux transporter MFP subunit
MVRHPMSANPPRRSGRWPWILGTAAIAGALAAWLWLGNGKSQDAQAARKGPGAIPVVTARAETRDIPVKIKANGTVTALQSVELRAQVTSTVREVHIREGQDVRRGDLLFSLDSRAEEANLKKAQAQVEKDRADLATAQRNLARQRELFQQKFVSQAALDAVQNQVDTLNGQLAIDTAAIESARVARAYMEIRAPFSGRTGAITVRPGSLVQPNGAVLVTISQIDPITATFTLPERELAELQRAMSGGALPVTAEVANEKYTGKVTFIDNAVDTATGTIRVKAEFANSQSRLWPGMYVNVEMAPRTIAAATVVPAQAVQTGPANRFVFTVGDDGKVTSTPVTLDYVEEGLAVVAGLPPGARVVVEGAQNLRPGSLVAEADRSNPGEAPADAAAKKGKGKGKGAKKGEA